jgi:hypothetical protein
LVEKRKRKKRKSFPPTTPFIKRKINKKKKDLAHRPCGHALELKIKRAF